MKRVIALGALLAGGALLVAPGAGAATTTCPPGTTNSPYCTPAVVLITHTVTSNGASVTVSVKCAATTRCKGNLLLVVGGGSARIASAASSASSQGTTVGSASYSIAPGGKIGVTIRLSKKGRALLQRKGRLRVSVVSVVAGKRTTLGSLLIKAKAKHVTNVKGHPGFTG